MAGRAIDCIFESLVTGDLGVNDFMQAVQKNIEHLEIASDEMRAAEWAGKSNRLKTIPH
jgi:hypothetical protein